MASKKPAALDPAGTIIRRLGGPIVVAKATRTAYTAPYRWQTSRSRGGTGGLIPQRHHRALLRYAQRNRIKLKALDLLPYR